ncbi:Hypothetical protein CINCED_3A010873 [Cinara cedri]|uniref:Uncharacterized protein n=1 Tax=Cinara cedri TaxID=506608 RepID=A0A5E4NJV8_9HEMI|nr:Hypothetical protein CINCED_3A010873 [Cinara cedri]
MDQGKKDTCQPHYLSNLKIPKGVTITPVVQDEDKKIISLLKKLPNITFTCYNPKPVFKVPEPPKPIKKNVRNGSVKSQNNSISNINQVLNVNGKNLKRNSNHQDISENYIGKENNQTIINNYKEKCFYSLYNTKKPNKSETLLHTKPVDNIPKAIQIIDLSEDNTDSRYNSLSVDVGQSEYSNANLKNNQNNKVDYSMGIDMSIELNENLLLQEIGNFCDNLVKQNSEVADSSKPTKKNDEQTLKRKYNATISMINNADKTVKNNSENASEKYTRKKNNEQISFSNAKKVKKSETFSKNKLIKLKTVTPARKVNNLAIDEDYTLMDISTMGKVSIIPSPPPLDLINLTDPGHDGFSAGLDECENSNVHLRNKEDRMVEDTYNVQNDKQLLQKMTSLFCENLVEKKSDAENVLLINDF